MWAINVSDGRHIAGIVHEADARRSIHAMGVTEVVCPYTWHLTDNQGHVLTATLRRG